MKRTPEWHLAVIVYPHDKKLRDRRIKEINNWEWGEVSKEVLFETGNFSNEETMTEEFWFKNAADAVEFKLRFG